MKKQFINFRPDLIAKTANCGSKANFYGTIKSDTEELALSFVPKFLRDELGLIVTDEKGRLILIFNN